MKVCCKCGIEKLHTEFYKDKTQKDGLEGKCKVCSKAKAMKWQQTNPERKKINNERWNSKNPERVKELSAKSNRKHYKSVKLPYWIVYILPNEYYAGVTTCAYKRMSVHKYRFKRDITGWYEVARYNTKQEALAHEAQLHAQGYKGAYSRKRQHKVT